MELVTAVIASMAALPQSMVQPGFLHNWQSRLDLVLHILASGENAQSVIYCAVCIVGELAGGGSVAVAVGVGDR